MADACVSPVSQAEGTNLRVVVRFKPSGWNHSAATHVVAAPSAPASHLQASPSHSPFASHRHTPRASPRASNTKVTLQWDGSMPLGLPPVAAPPAPSASPTHQRQRSGHLAVDASPRHSSSSSPRRTSRSADSTVDMRLAVAAAEPYLQFDADGCTVTLHSPHLSSTHGRKPLHPSASTHSSPSSASSSHHSYTFDRVLPPSSTQIDLFESIGRGAVRDALAGFNATVLAYGQSGAGKSYSIFGGSSAAEPGLLPQCAEFLFDELHAITAAAAASTSPKSASPPASASPAESTSPLSEVTLMFSFVEIQQAGELRDLLLQSPSSHGQPAAAAPHAAASHPFEPPDLKLRESTSTGEVYVQNLTGEYVSSAEELMGLVEQGTRARTQGHPAGRGAGLHPFPRRSHAIATLQLTQRFADGSSRCSKLTFVDLAGSERASATAGSAVGAGGGAHLNASLATLGQVLTALADPNRTHIPFRDSALTWLLRDSLSGNVRTSVLFCVPSAAEDASTFSDSLHTLELARRCRRIKTQAQVNRQRSVKELNSVVLALRAQLAALQGSRSSTAAGASSSKSGSRRMSQAGTPTPLSIVSLAGGGGEVLTNDVGVQAPTEEDAMQQFVASSREEGGGEDGALSWPSRSDSSSSDPDAALEASAGGDSSDFNANQLLSRWELLALCSQLHAAHTHLSTTNFLLQAENADYLGQVESLSLSVRSLQSIIDARNGAAAEEMQGSGAPSTPRSNRSNPDGGPFYCPSPFASPSRTAAAAAATAHANELNALTQALALSQSNAEAAAAASARQINELRAQLDASRAEANFRVEGLEFAKTDLAQQLQFEREERSREQALYAERIGLLEADVASWRAKATESVAAASVAPVAQPDESTNLAMATLQSELVAAQSALESLQLANASLSDTLSRKQAELATHSDTVSQLQVQFAALMVEKSRADAQIQRLISNYELQDQHVIAVKAERRAREEEVQALEAELALLRAAMTEMEQLAEEREKHVSQLQSDAAGMQVELAAAVTAAAAARSGQVLESELSMLRSQLTEQSNLCASQRAELVELREHERLMESLRDQLTHLQAELAEHTAALQGVRTKLAESEEANLHGQAALEAVTEESNARAHELQAARSECDALRLDLSRAHSDAALALAAASSAPAEAAQIAQAALADKDKLISEMEVTLKRKEELHADELARVGAEAEARAVAMQREHKSALDERDAQIQEAIAQSQHAEKAHSSRLTELQVTVSQLELALAQAQTESADTAATIAAEHTAQLSTLHLQLSSLQEQVAVCERSLAQKDAEFQRAESAHASAMAKLVEEHAAALATHSRHLASTEASLVTARASIAAMEARLAAATAAAADAEMWRAELEQLRQREAEHLARAAEAARAHANLVEEKQRVEDSLRETQQRLRLTDMQLQQLQQTRADEAAAPRDPLPSPAALSETLYSLSLARSELVTAQESFAAQVSSLTRELTSARAESAFLRASLSKLQAQFLTQGKTLAEAQQATADAEMESAAARKAGVTTASTLRQVQERYEAACSRLGETPVSAASIAAEVTLASAQAASNNAELTAKLAEVQSGFVQARQKLAHYVKLLRAKDVQIADLQGALQRAGNNVSAPVDPFELERATPLKRHPLEAGIGSLQSPPVASDFALEHEYAAVRDGGTSWSSPSVAYASEGRATAPSSQRRPSADGFTPSMPSPALSHPVSRTDRPVRSPHAAAPRFVKPLRLQMDSGMQPQPRKGVSLFAALAEAAEKVAHTVVTAATPNKKRASNATPAHVEDGATPLPLYRSGSNSELEASAGSPASRSAADAARYSRSADNDASGSFVAGMSPRLSRGSLLSPNRKHMAQGSLLDDAPRMHVDWHD